MHNWAVSAFWFLFTFCHKGGFICISEVIGISPGNLDSSLCFIQSGVSPDEPCSTVVFTMGKYLHISGPVQFKPVLLKGQLCILRGMGI